MEDPEKRLERAALLRLERIQIGGILENLDTIEAVYCQLPEAYRKRIDRFTRNRLDFFWRGQPIELFVSEQAVAIARGLRPMAMDALAMAILTDRKEWDQAVHGVVADFYQVPWEDKLALVPDLLEGRYPYTLDVACRLAYWELEGRPDKIEGEHAVTCQIEGCYAAGCISEKELVQIIRQKIESEYMAAHSEIEERARSIDDQVDKSVRRALSNIGWQGYLATCQPFSAA